jgi:L-arabinonolactonase
MNGLSAMHVTMLDAPAAALGESPLWDPDARRLFWVDTVGCKVWNFDPQTGATRFYPTPSPVGSIGLADKGRLVAALAHGFSLLDLETGALTPLWEQEHDPLVRMNDGKMDRYGRYLCGSMGVKADPLGRLYRLEGNGQVEVLKTGIRIYNATCFSPDGGTLYCADSLSHRIVKHSYAEDGTLGPEQLFCDTNDLGSGPDGATVDAEGYLWVALIKIAKLGRFAPDGTLHRLVDTPLDLPSCPAFGGPDLSTLYVTSIKDSGTGRAISTHQDGGRVMAFEGLGVRGLPEARLRLA